MASEPLSLLFLLLTLLLPSICSQECLNQNITSNNLYANCVDLPYLSSFLHWTYDDSNSSVSVAFSAPPPTSDGWIAWAINPTSTGMVGAQALIAFKQSEGAMEVKIYSITSYSSVKESKLSFEVWDTAAEFEGGLMRIFAKVKVPEKAETVNQVWQVGSSVADGMPSAHAFEDSNVNAKGTLSLIGKQSGAAPTSDPRLRKKNIHGVLNAVSWGAMFPIGVLMARYLKTIPSADPAWFYLHVFCQVSAYAIGIAGWATGLKLGSESEGIVHTAHRNIGITLFCLATLQVCALFLRPHKDHKYRFFWNIYHHSVGYTIVVMGVINVFKGFNILNPQKKWKSDYIVVLGTLCVIAILLEAITWIFSCSKKSRKSAKQYNGINEHGFGI